MPYIDSSGNIVESHFSIVEVFSGFFFFFICFFKSLFGPFLSGSKASKPRAAFREGGGDGGSGRWPGSGGPGGPPRGYGGGPRRTIGRLPRSSGMNCPPMAGGG